jgi:succinylglutamate desuccinylase
MMFLGIFVFSAAIASPIPAEAATTTKTVTIASGTKYATPMYVIKSSNPGPVVMIVGGVHGNETAGYKAAAQVKDFSIQKGTLLVIPQANKLAVANHTRTYAGMNLNRDFPTSSSDSADTTLSKSIFNQVKSYDVDWLIDMHEGGNYARITSSTSVGQSLIYYPDSQTKEIGSKIVNSLNSNISTSYKKFSLLQYPVSGSLARAAAVVCGTNSFIFETCSRDSLDTRVSRQLKAANMLLDYLNMK